MSRIFPCLLESFMSRICLVLFVWNLSRIFSCLEYVQFYLSRICPEFFHVQNMSGKKFWNFSCPEFVQFICPDFVQIFFMSGICPEFVWFFGYEKFQTIIFPDISRHFLDMKKNSGQFLDNFDDIFQIFLFYRASAMFNVNLLIKSLFFSIVSK